MQLSLFSESAIDNEELVECLRGLPKIELHAHLSGCLRLSTVRELTRTRDLRVSTSASRDLSKAIIFTSPARSYAASFAPWRSVLNKVMEAPDIVERLIMEVAEDFALDGVIYAELRVSPRLPLANGDLDEFLSAVNAGTANALRRFGVDIRGILGFTRHTFYQLSKDEQLRTVGKILTAAQPYQGHSIVGFDLWGNEQRHPPRCFESAFSLVREAGYPITIHAGEVYSASSIRDAVQLLKCRRIGHAASIAKDNSLFDLVRENNVTVEACLTSNWITGAVPDLSRHPLQSMHSKGLAVTLCTDNTLVYNTSLSEEVAKALRTGLLPASSVPQLWRNAVKGLFAPNVMRSDLLSTIDQAYTLETLKRLEEILCNDREERTSNASASTQVDP